MTKVNWVPMIDLIAVFQSLLLAFSMLQRCLTMFRMKDLLLLSSNALPQHCLRKYSGVETVSIQRRFASSILLFSTSCLSVTPSLAQTVNGRDWVTGDSWKYQHVDLWLNQVLGESERKVVSLSPDGTVMQVIEIGGAVFEETVRADGWTTRPLPPVPSGAGIYEYAFLTFPLEIGKVWEVVSYRYSQAAPLLLRISWTCRVEGNEDVVVPAGKFNSVRVQCDGWWVDRGWIGKEVQTLWFASAVRGVVRNRYAEHTSGGKVWNKWESSLVEFRPGK